MIWLVAGLVAVAAIAYWITRDDIPQVTATAAREVQLNSQTGTVLNATGYVTARRKATVSSKVTGRVEDVRLEEGMAVQRGQVLATLDSSNIRASLNLAEARLSASRSARAETKVQINEARIELDRIESLVENEISSEAELTTAKAKLDTLSARLERQSEEQTVAARELDVWKQQMEDTIIRAPFSGIVVAKNAQPGEMISPVSAGGGFTRTGIGTIVDMQSLEIEVDVNEAYINRVQADQAVEATLDSYSDWKIPATVIAIVPTADRDRATVRVRIGFDELDSRILPDMGVRVAFREDDDTSPVNQMGVAIPRDALAEIDGQEIVWLVHEGIVERRAVRAIDRSAEPVLITSGLIAGDRVITNPPETLSDGDRVREKNE